jgi:hypothetical protein
MKTTTTLFLLLTMIVSGCDLFAPNTSVTVELPELPVVWSHLAPELRFELEYSTDTGETEHRSLAPGTRNVEIIVRKLRNRPVLCYPVFKGSRLNPAGGVWPYDLAPGNDDMLRLSWEHGFVATVLFSLESRGIDTIGVNGERLLDEIDEKADGNPWNLDPSRIMNDLAGETFTVYSIKARPSTNIILEQAAGEWFGTNPFTTIYRSEPNGTLSIDDLPLGYHRFFALTGGESIELETSENETIWIRRSIE